MANWLLLHPLFHYPFFFLCLARKLGDAIATADDIRRRKQWQDKLKITKASYPPEGE